MNRLRQHSRREHVGFVGPDGFVLFLSPQVACAPPAHPTCSQHGGGNRVEPSEDCLNAYLNAAWETSCPSAISKLVLVCLADHSNAKGICWPSRERIAVRCSMSVRNVGRALLELRNVGLLQIVHTGRSSRYRLCLAREDSVVPTGEPSLASPIVTVTDPKKNLLENSGESLWDGMRKL